MLGRGHRVSDKGHGAEDMGHRAEGKGQRVKGRNSGQITEGSGRDQSQGKGS